MKRILNELPPIMRRRWYDVITSPPVLEVRPDPKKRPVYVAVVRKPETVRTVLEVLQLPVEPELPFLELHIDSDGELLMAVHTNLEEEAWIHVQLHPSQGAA